MQETRSKLTPFDVYLQFYTFLETALVTLSLLPYFMAFFTDEDISEPVTTLAVSFIAFGEFLKI